MAAQYDIAVIGGGVIGLALARELAAHSVSIAIVDDAARTPPASLAAAGMLAPSFEETLGGAALYEFSAASLRLWPAFADALTRETGIDVDYRGGGMLGVALDEDGAKALEAQSAALIKRGASIRMLTGNEARLMEPVLSNRVTAAVYATDDAQVDPIEVMKALQAALKKRGVQLIADRAVHVEREAGSWRISLGDGDILFADQIVVTTGAAADWPIAGIARPPIFPVKGEAFSVTAPATPALSRVVRGPGAYLCPKAGGRVVIGATEAKGSDDLIVSDKGVEGLRANAVQVAPVLGSCAETARWAGLRPATPDGAPILGCYDGAAAGAYVALGHHRNGILLTPASAAALALEILGRPGEIDLSAFRVARFA